MNENVKTAKEILKECFLGVIDFNEEAALDAMKKYAKQSIDQAAKEADYYAANSITAKNISKAIAKLKKELK